MIDSILTNTLLPEISNKFLTHLLEKKPVTKVEVSTDNGEFIYTLEH